MKIKIKCQPEDFIVEEKANLPRLEVGPFAVYKLKKRGWNTVDAIRQISRAWDLRYGDCAYGGKKDRWGLTTQWITIRGGREKCLELKDIALDFLGYTDRPMGPDAIEANLFKTVVRDLNEDQAGAARDACDNVTRAGFVNYFDDQRFGGYDPKQGFLADRLLKGHFNGVLKAYLSSTHPEDKKEEKARKAFFDQHWKDWQACLGMAKTSFEKRVFARLVNDPRGMLSLIEDIPPEDLHMAISAYQSFLWNEVVRRLLINRHWAQCVYDGVAGDYIFFEKLSPHDHEYLKDMTVVHPAAKAQMPDKIVGKIYEKVLTENELQPNIFNKMKTRKVFFKPTPRKVLIKPKDVAVKIDADELYAGKRKVLLEFSLPRGSYATMFIKRIFARPFVVEDVRKA
ncbi:MAG: tRNA pseudouridine(13) synthase TruD [Candidatus Omnitrophica bacterium]|nr:tRNA pseudouridine(13) synthase TruD [Candidatus Omnitrophota bacterium]